MKTEELEVIVGELNTMAYAATGDDGVVYCPFSLLIHSEQTLIRIFDYPIWDSEEDGWGTIQEAREALNQNLSAFCNAMMDISNQIKKLPVPDKYTCETCGGSSTEDKIFTCCLCGKQTCIDCEATGIEKKGGEPICKACFNPDIHEEGPIGSEHSSGLTGEHDVVLDAIEGKED